MLPTSLQACCASEPERAEHSLRESVELNIPVSTAYNQWTQFEDFLSFMASRSTFGQEQTSIQEARCSG